MDSNMKYLFEMYQNKKNGQRLDNILVHEYFENDDAKRGTAYILDIDKKIFTRIMIFRNGTDLLDNLPENFSEYKMIC